MVRLAVERFRGKVRGQPVEVVSSDPQNKPEIGVSIATKWFDEGVDAIVDVPNSSIAFAISELAKQRKQAVLRHRAGLVRNPRIALFHQHHAVGREHILHSQGGGHGHSQEKGRVVVLPDDRLLLRPGAGA